MKLWLRDETKQREKRTPLTPADAKKLIDAGVEITVEESQNRVFSLKEYENVGCQTAPAHSWKTAPQEFIILGLKEIEDLDVPLSHRHIYFAHIFKGQAHASQVFKQYEKGGGTLFDLEFLTDETGRRVAAFGKWAGFAGAAFALDRFYYCQTEKDPYPGLKAFTPKEELIESIQARANRAENKKPKVIIIGAKGRCGKGAQELLDNFSLQATHWDYEETKAGGPFHEIIEHDIFINAALIMSKIPPFLTKEMVRSQECHLKVIADVSCDPSSDLNPIPLYDQCTTWEHPFLSLDQTKGLEILSVDNLPSTIPKESSEEFSELLLPHLLNLHKEKDLPTPFKNAKKVFEEKKLKY